MRIKKNNEKTKSHAGRSYYQGESPYKNKLAATNGLASDNYFQGKIDEDDGINIKS